MCLIGGGTGLILCEIGRDFLIGVLRIVWLMDIASIL